MAKLKALWRKWSAAERACIILGVPLGVILLPAILVFMGIYGVSVLIVDVFMEGDEVYEDYEDTDDE